MRCAVEPLRYPAYLDFEAVDALILPLALKNRGWMWHSYETHRGAFCLVALIVNSETVADDFAVAVDFAVAFGVQAFRPVGESRDSFLEAMKRMGLQRSVF